MLSGLLQQAKGMLTVAVLLLLTSAANAQTVLSSGQLATCVNDGSVSSSFTPSSDRHQNACFRPVTNALLVQTTTATLTCSQKVIVNLVIAAGSNLVTESLDFTVPCIGRCGLPLQPCMLAYLSFNILFTGPVISHLLTTQEHLASRIGCLFAEHPS